MTRPGRFFFLLCPGLFLSPGARRASARCRQAQILAATRWILLITPREREVFRGSRAPADREAFIQRFWQARDPYPETPRNEARERWEERLAEARSALGR